MSAVALAKAGESLSRHSKLNMILVHSIIGLMPVDNHHFSWYWFIGSIIPDIDHLFILYQHKIFSRDKIVDVMRFEKKYNLHFKTKYLHSVFGAIVMTVPVLLINSTGAVYFFTAYILALLLDWPDIDEKQYLFPFKKKFRGFLPIFSIPERVITLVLLVLLIYFYL